MTARLGGDLVRAMLLLVVLTVTENAVSAANAVEVAQRQTLDAMEEAWNRGDVDGMIKVHTTDAEYVNAGNGFYWRGHEELRQGWARVLARGGGKTQVVSRTIRQVSAEVAVVVDRVRIDIPDAQRRPGNPPSIEGISSHVLVRQGGRWLITYGQSTLVTPPVQPPG